MYRCKFCGEPLKQSQEDYYEFFYCNCDGTKQYIKLQNELADLRRKVFDKERELHAFELCGAYGEVKANRDKIDKELNQFRDANYIGGNNI